MRISVNKLNALLEKEYQRGKATIEKELDYYKKHHDSREKAHDEIQIENIRLRKKLELKLTGKVEE